MFNPWGSLSTGNFVLDRWVAAYPAAPPSVVPQPVALTDGVGNTKVVTPEIPATNPDANQINHAVPISKGPVVNWVPPVLTMSKDTSGGSLTLSDGTFQRWWKEVVQGNISIWEKIWKTTQMALGWVIGNYTDWFQQINQWDGTWKGLLLHTHLLWRSIVVFFLTLGMLEIAPLLGVLLRWVELMFELMRATFRLVGDAVEELWYLMTRIYDDIKALIRMF